MVTLDAIAAEEAPILQQLFELYAYDWSETLPLELKPNGRFDIAIDPRWFNSSEHHPFFIRAEGKLLGFALARKGSRVTADADVMDVAEFLVIRGARRRQVGKRAAHALFGAFAGRWEVRVRRSNTAALEFWSRTVLAWAGEPPTYAAFVVDGVDWDALRFSAPTVGRTRTNASSRAAAGSVNRHFVACSRKCADQRLPSTS